MTNQAPTEGVLASLGSAIAATWEAARRQPLLGFGFPAIVTILAVVLVLVLPRRYESEASFVPEATEGINLPSAVLGLISQLNLKGPGAAESPAFYVRLLQSRPVLEHLLSIRPTETCGKPPATLLELLGTGGRSRADSLYRGRKRLDHRTSSGVDLRTGVVTVGVEAACPGLAQELTDSLLQSVNTFNIETRQSRARLRREFLESRLGQAEQDLRAAEDTLQTFLQRNKVYSSPELSFTYERLSHRVDSRQEVTDGLRHEFDNARLEEVNSTPLITVLEPASTPVRPSWPKRRLTVILTAILSVMIGAGLALFRTLSRPLEEPAPPALRRMYHSAQTRLFGRPPRS